MFPQSVSRGARFSRLRWFATATACQVAGPCTDLTGLPATGGFYFQAFDRSVVLPVAGYNYNSVWTPLLAGLSPAGMAASVAALVRPCVARVFRRSGRCGLASMYPASAWSDSVPGHNGYQRACDLISGQASTGPLGPPVVACAGKTDFSIIVSSSRRPRRVVDYIIGGSSFHGCSFVRAWRPFLRPGLRVQARRAQGPSRLAVGLVLPLAPCCQATRLDGPEHGARITLDGTPSHRS